MEVNVNSFVVVDVEATCDDRGTVPKQEMEIIEIGAVMVTASSYAPVDEFQSFVQPVRHRILTPFCSVLTSISQAEVESAPLFPAVMNEFTRWIYSHPNPIVFCSWGDYDRKQFAQDCEFHRVPYGLPHQHINLKRKFAESFGNKKLGMAEALRHLGFELVGMHHRGIDDARNIARLVPYALGIKQ